MAKPSKRLKMPDHTVGKPGWGKWAQEQKPAGMRVPDGWVGGPNRWTSEERNQWRDFCLNPKGGDPQAGAGSRGRAVSYGGRPDSVDDIYRRMVKRGIVAK